MYKFRALNAEEVDARVSTISEKGLSLLLYKDARCDMRILDETVGAENWQREHYECKGNLFCRVGIRCGDDWVFKSDCGTESYTEKEKGESSDSFKRACFNWGIGRELYTAPFIWIPSVNSDGAPNYEAKNNPQGKPTTRDRFIVTFMNVADGKIVGLNIENAKKHRTVYTYGKLTNKEKTDEPSPDNQTWKNNLPMVCCVCGKSVTAENALKSMQANNGKVYCSGTCKRKDE